MTARPDLKGVAVRTEALGKTKSGPRYEVPAVRELGLEIAEGEFFGLLSPNGAGKSAARVPRGRVAFLRRYGAFDVAINAAPFRG